MKLVKKKISVGTYLHAVPWQMLNYREVCKDSKGVIELETVK